MSAASLKLLRHIG